jgi:hypothetical protein
MIGRLQADQCLEPALLFINRALSEHTLGKLMTLVLCYFVRNCLRRCLWSDGYFDYLNSVGHTVFSISFSYQRLLLFVGRLHLNRFGFRWSTSFH